MPARRRAVVAGLQPGAAAQFAGEHDAGGVRPAGTCRPPPRGWAGHQRHGKNEPSTTAGSLPRRLKTPTAGGTKTGARPRPLSTTSQLVSLQGAGQPEHGHGGPYQLRGEEVILASGENPCECGCSLPCLMCTFACTVGRLMRRIAGKGWGAPALCGLLGQLWRRSTVEMGSNRPVWAESCAPNSAYRHTLLNLCPRF